VTQSAVLALRDKFTGLQAQIEQQRNKLRGQQPKRNLFGEVQS